MSERYNLDFLEDPIEFAKNHTIFCAADPGYQCKETTYFLSVPSDNRVCYWNILEEQENDSGNYCLVQISRNKVDEFFGGFYLPYIENGVIRCTLKDKRNLKEKTSRDEAKAFFTHYITGCSIIIEGPPENPTIYHANNLKASRNKSRKKIAKNIEGKWKKTKPPKYITNLSETSKKKKIIITGSALHAKDYLANEKELLKNYEAQSDQPQIYGMVFGVKTEDSWSFYLQQYITERIPNPPFAMRTVQKFWPGGQLASVVKRPSFKRKKKINKEKK